MTIHQAIRDATPPLCAKERAWRKGAVDLDPTPAGDRRAEAVFRPAAEALRGGAPQYAARFRPVDWSPLRALARLSAAAGYFPCPLGNRGKNRRLRPPLAVYPKLS